MEENFETLNFSMHLGINILYKRQRYLRRYNLIDDKVC